MKELYNLGVANGDGNLAVAYASERYDHTMCNDDIRNYRKW